jgi:hypothetical protein
MDELRELIRKWESYIEKMRAGIVNFVHESTKAAVQDHIELAEHFIADLQGLAQPVLHELIDAPAIPDQGQRVEQAPTTDAGVREMAERIHLKLAAAQNLPYNDGDTCEECIELARELAALAQKEAGGARVTAEQVIHFAYVLEGNAEYWLGLESPDSQHHGKWLNNIAAEIRALVAAPKEGE